MYEAYYIMTKFGDTDSIQFAFYYETLISFKRTATLYQLQVTDIFVLMRFDYNIMCLVYVL